MHWMMWNGMVLTGTATVAFAPPVSPSRWGGQCRVIGPTPAGRVPSLRPNP